MVVDCGGFGEYMCQCFISFVLYCVQNGC